MYANVNPSISKKLFNGAFAVIWSQFNDTHKSSVIKNLEKTIQSANVPLSVLQTILNLAEFMEHDSQGLQLDITSMANLAERCNAHAKALYYREIEFQFAPESTIESLISLYSNLGQPEASSGMLVFAQKTLMTKVEVKWHESLGRWQDALTEYQKEISDSQYKLESNLEALIRCYYALSEWNVVLSECDKLLLKDENSKNFGNVAHLAAKASMQLSQWETLEKFVEHIDSQYDDPSFYNAVVFISKDKLDEATEEINKSRKKV